MAGFCRLFSVIALAAFLLAAAPPAGYAQKEPRLPEPLQNLRNEGAQLRYLGKYQGLDGWIAIKNGQEQYFYVTENGQAFVLGLLFDKSGKVLTLQQVSELQKKSDGEVLDLFADDNFGREQEMAPSNQSFDQLVDRAQKEFKTPAEQLYDDVESSNWIPLGDTDAPFIYTFIDPQCPHCHSFIKDMLPNHIRNGLVQVRIIPVGRTAETKAQAAFLLAVPNPQKRWYAHLEGDEAALPVTPDINEQGVQRNLSIMQSWKVDVTPFTVYRAKSGDVKIVKGRAQDISQIISDLR